MSGTFKPGQKVTLNFAFGSFPSGTVAYIRHVYSTGEVNLQIGMTMVNVVDPNWISPAN